MALAVLALALVMPACSRVSQSGLMPDDVEAMGFEAESAIVEDGFVVGSDPQASQEHYLVQGGNSDTGSPEIATIAVTLASDDQYTLWARAKAPADRPATLNAGFDGDVQPVRIDNAGGFAWLPIVDSRLAAGAHLVSIATGDAGVKLDLFVLARTSEALSERDLEARFVGEDANESADPDDVGESDESASEQPSEPEPTAPTTDDASDVARENLSLRGDPSFDVERLDAAQRVWHQRTRKAMQRSSVATAQRARKDDSYEMGRGLFQYDAALLLALRATGDLRFLDAVDEVAQVMRGQLRDGWCASVDDEVDNGPYGATYEDDGFLNFRWSKEKGNRHYCRDTGDLDEALTHGHLAMLQYAYHLNRDLESPSGVDYAERADFWLDYLRNHFEAKWRTRSNTAWPDMDFIDVKFCHTYSQFVLYHYFIGKRLQMEGDPDAAAYLGRAREMTDAMFEVAYVPGEQTGGFVDVDTPMGPAVIYSFGSPGLEMGSASGEACPVTYARYAVTSMTTLRMEGFHSWGDDIMEKLATGFAHFVMDTDNVTSKDRPFAAGVSGSEKLAQIPPTEYRSRLDLGKYGVTTIAALAAWDHSGRIRDISRQAYEALEPNGSNPSDVFIPASALFVMAMDRASVERWTEPMAELRSVPDVRPTPFTHPPHRRASTLVDRSHDGVNGTRTRAD